MKRLTKYLASGAADYNYPADCYGGNDCNDRAAKSAYRQTCVERLAAYEDTGLTPEEVLPKDKADEIALKLMRLADLESFCSYDRLRELAEADKDGRVAVLPRRVGDIVWANLDGMRHPRKCVIEFGSVRPEFEPHFPEIPESSGTLRPTEFCPPLGTGQKPALTPYLTTIRKLHNRV